jgi:sugar lactone lactonase YvrE
VWDVIFAGGRVFAATGAGVYSADPANTGLAYFGNWALLNNMPLPEGKYTLLAWAGGKLYANLSVKDAGGDYVYVWDGAATLFSFIPGAFNRSFEPAGNGFIITSSASVRQYGSDGSLVRTVSSAMWPDPDFYQAVEYNQEIWIADRISGLIRYDDSNTLKSYTLPGPLSNNAFHISSADGKTIISGGGADVSWNNLWRSLQISIHDGNDWTGISSSSVSDGMRSLIDPDDRTHFFVSTWGGGLLEYRNNELVNIFDYTNSPLQTIIPGRPYVRICGLAMDKDKNLWITQSGVTGSLKVLKPDGNWIVNPLTIDVQTIGDLIITRRGHKWVVLPRGSGLFVFDDNDTPETFGDDRSKKIFVETSDGSIVSNIYSIAEDLEENIWVGTDQGPLIYYNPERVLEENLRAFRIRIPRNDGTDIYDYMLKTETITAIAVDGANRKWLATSGSGAYLLSPDGTVQIRNYNETNSPVLSNNIASLTVDNKTGDVWFGTSMGIQSVRGDAVKGEDKFNNVYSFPNPVRQDFTGNVTIKGLMSDSQIKITDISGNLVYETESSGGEASWDLKTYNGKRVSTGVYLVFCASSDGTQSCVTKMLVIK